MMLDLQGISKSFLLPNNEDLDVIRNLSLTVSAGEVVAIVGKSGSGKSTLLHILGLLERPTKGSYALGGVETTSLSEREKSRYRGEEIGFVFQQFHLLDRRTALENVAEPTLYGSARELTSRFERARELLAAVGMSHREASMPHLLSGGEQQRVAIARALQRRPKLLLADEPTGALDEETGTQVLDLLLTLVRTTGMTLVLVTHDADVASQADRVLHMVHGELVSEKSA